MKECPTTISIRYLAKSVSQDQIDELETFKNKRCDTFQGPAEDCLVTLFIFSHILHHSHPRQELGQPYP